MVAYNRFYIIIKHLSDKIWVTLTECCDTSEFWNSLESDIQNLGIVKAEVFFDFAIQSGPYNRFLYGIYQNRKLRDGIKPLSQNNGNIIDVFNSYWCRHIGIINESSLSSREKSMLLHSIQS